MATVRETSKITVVAVIVMIVIIYTKSTNYKFSSVFSNNGLTQAKTIEDVVSLSSLNYSKITLEQWFQKNAWKASSFQIAGMKYNSGIGFNLDSHGDEAEVIYKLGSNYKRITGFFGTDDLEKANTTDTNQLVLYGNGKKIYESPQMQPGVPPTPVDIDLSGVDQLEIHFISPSGKYPAFVNSLIYRQESKGATQIINNIKKQIQEMKTCTGEVRQLGLSKVYDFKIHFLNFDSSSGKFSGELTWLSENAIHKIEGKLNGYQLTFKETDYIKRSQTMLLGANYNLLPEDSDKYSGTWKDDEHKISGTILLKIGR